MKKLLFIVGLGLCLTASAQDWQFKSMLNGYASIGVTNNTTTSISSTNVCTNGAGITVIANSGLILSNGVAGAGLALYSTNYTTAGSWQTNVNTSYGPPLNDAVPLWADRNGASNAPVEFAISTIGHEAASTNTITVTLQRLIPYTYANAFSTNLISGNANFGLITFNGTTNGVLVTTDTGVQDQFTLLYAGNGTTPVNLTTNLPLSFTSGSYGFRATVASSSAAGSTITFVQRMGYGGYIP